MKPILLLVAMLLIFSTTASGQLYEWTDDKGSVSFTDDPEHIPAKYRSRAKVREGTGKGLPEKVETKREKLAAEPEPPTRAAPELYGGRVLSWWQASYVERKSRVEGLQAELARLKDEQILARRKKLTHKRLMDRKALAEKTEAVAAMEVRVKDAEKELAEFRSTAENSGIPVDMLESGSR